jgi:large subunit ribosomal protein L11
LVYSEFSLKLTNLFNHNKKADRSYFMEIFKPPVGFLLKQAAGINRASMEPGHKIGGIITLKHVYEIAKYKSEDLKYAHYSIQQMCVRVISTASRMGIKVVKHDLDPKELGEFLTERASVEKAELAEIAEKRAAKMMRASAAAAAANAANMAKK